MLSYESSAHGRESFVSSPIGLLELVGGVIRTGVDADLAH
jgi:hypothetical protein